MPKLVRMYIQHVLIGFVLSLIFVGLLLWFNVVNLWHLVTATSDGPWAVFLLVVFNTIVFGGVQFGIAVMRMGDDPDQGSGLKQRVAPAPVPVPVAKPATRRG